MEGETSVKTDKKKPSLIKEVITSTKEALIIEPSIEILSNHLATIQGAKGIIEYTDELVRVSLADREVRFYGEGLSIGCLTRDSLEISGKIARLEYV